MTELYVENKKKFNFKYLLIFFALEVIAAISTSIAAPLLGYKFSTNGEIVFNDPLYLETILFFIQKIFPVIVALVVLRNDVKKVFGETKKAFINFIIYTAISFFVFLFFSSGEQYLIELFGGEESNNQNSIYALFALSSEKINYILIFIIIVILAPILEELEYRYLIFKMFEGCHFIVPVLVSSALFASAHLLSAETVEELIEGLKFFPVYFLPGFALAMIYHYSKNNFLATTLIHAISNALAFYTIIQDFLAPTQGVSL